VTRSEAYLRLPTRSTDINLEPVRRSLEGLLTMTAARVGVTFRLGDGTLVL
jgi:hypothetical protein